MNQGAPTAIIVAGMHRSGTSASAGALRLMGVSLGARLLAPGDDNPKGYWENERAVEIHEQLLAALGRRWDDVRSLPEGWQSSDAAKSAAAEIDALIATDFADAPLWAVKDPRICRLLPLWLETLQARQVRTVVLLVVRRPSEVAASIEARNQWATPLGELLWLRHVIEAEAASRDVPRAVIVYDELLAAPAAAIRAALAPLGVDVSLSDSGMKRLERFVDADDRHHVHDEDGPRDPLAAIAQRTYQALVDISRGMGEWSDVQLAVQAFDAEWSRCGSTIDAVAGMAHRFMAGETSAHVENARLASELHAQVRWAEQAVETYGAAEAEHLRLQAEFATLHADRAGVLEQRDRLLAEHLRLQAEFATLHADRDRLLAEHLRLQAEFATLHADRDRLLAEHTALQAEMDAASQAIAAVSADLEAMRNSRSWRMTRPLRTLATILRRLRK